MEEYKETLFCLLSDGSEFNLGSMLSVCICVYHIIHHVFKDKEVDEIVPNPKY